jgi:hypothetical protein
MPDGHPSPLVFPPETPPDSTLRDSTGSAAFARTQDLLREAGAESMLNAVLTRMPEATKPLPEEGGLPPMSMAPATGGDLGSGSAPIDPERCARSLRIVNAPRRGQVAVWWTRRSRGRVALMAAWKMNGDGGAMKDGGHGDTKDGAHGAMNGAMTGAAGGAAMPDAQDSVPVWRGPISVDTVDQGAGDANATERGAVGCNRPAPGVAVDSANGYVHVAYALNAPEGSGIFYAHQMDPRSAFEPTAVIVYGDRKLGVARVSTTGNVVAVVYEDPNAPIGRGRIGLAISRSSGHVFESRVDASPLGKAVDPYVLVRGSAAVVGWSDVDSSVSSTAAFRMRRGIVR